RYAATVYAGHGGTPGHCSGDFHAGRRTGTCRHDLSPRSGTWAPGGPGLRRIKKFCAWPLQGVGRVKKLYPFHCFKKNKGATMQRLLRLILTTLALSGVAALPAKAQLLGNDT